MTLIAICQKCGHEGAIDRHCGWYCYNCLDEYSDIEHKPDCPIIIVRRIEKTKATAILHNLIEKQQLNIQHSRETIEAIQLTLRETDRCEECKGQSHHWTNSGSSCPHCKNTGYNLKPTKEALAEKPPEIVFG